MTPIESLPIALTTAENNNNRIAISQKKWYLNNKPYPTIVSMNPVRSEENPEKAIIESEAIPKKLPYSGGMGKKVDAIL